MDAKYLVVNHDRQRQEVKHVGKVRPDMRRPVLPHTFRIEPVCLTIFPGRRRAWGRL